MFSRVPSNKYMRCCLCCRTAVAAAHRPAYMPGSNRYAALDGPPAALRGSSSSSGSSSGGSTAAGGCSNATDASVRDRCYEQVGELVDVVGLAYMPGNVTSLTPAGMLVRQLASSRCVRPANRRV